MKNFRRNGSNISKNMKDMGKYFGQKLYDLIVRK